MAPQPVVTVFGATGNQGGGVAHQLLSSGKYAVRAVTRCFLPVHTCKCWLSKRISAMEGVRSSSLSQ
jgi:NmrA-like family